MASWSWGDWHGRLLQRPHAKLSPHKEMLAVTLAVMHVLLPMWKTSTAFLPLALPCSPSHSVVHPTSPPQTSLSHPARLTLTLSTVPQPWALVSQLCVNGRVVELVSFYSHVNILEGSGWAPVLWLYLLPEKRGHLGELWCSDRKLELCSALKRQEGDTASPPPLSQFSGQGFK
jgi:hypothetical protein